MNWKRFKQEIDKNPGWQDESKFILGIDLGSSQTKLAYYNVFRKEPELIDMSGGYGKPSIPTVVQYVPETKEWVFGEYALLNQGYFQDITIQNLISRLGKNEFVDIDGKPMGVSVLLGKLLQEVVGACKNMNPNAEIVGIAAVIPFYLDHEGRDELLKAFSFAGLSKELIGFVSDRECMLKYYHYFNDTSDEENLFLLDYGYQGVRGSVLKVHKSSAGYRVETCSSIIRDAAGAWALEKRILDLFIQYYCDQFQEKKEMLETHQYVMLENFVYQNKNLLFHDESFEKSVKLYFNFCYPPFQRDISWDTLAQLLRPFEKELDLFIDAVFQKTLEAPVQLEDIDNVLFFGGGLEMRWAKKYLEGKMRTKIPVNKNEQGQLALGACLYAAGKLGILPEADYHIVDRHQLRYDYGLIAQRDKKEKFVPIAEKNTFWWQQDKKTVLILNQSTEKPVKIPLLTRNDLGELQQIETLEIAGLPKRPKGTTRLQVSMEFESYNCMKATIKDCGFGEIFPKSSYERTYTIQI